MLTVEIVSCLLIIGLQLFVSLCLVGRSSNWVKMFSFTFLQALSIVLFRNIFTNTALLFLCSSATHLIYFMWIYNANLFPDTLAIYLLPLALKAFGELLFRHLLPRGQHLFTVSILPKPIHNLAAYVPITSLAIYFIIKKFWTRKKIGQQFSLKLDSTTCLTICGLIAMLCYFTCPSLNTSPISGAVFSNMFLSACFFLSPFTFFAVHHYIIKVKKTAHCLQYHVKQHAIQKSAVKTLREERHEFINELTLISTYLQMGKVDEAIVCIDYSSAKLADRNNYATLPHDAWLTVLKSKQKEAQAKMIDFQINVEAEAPCCFKEQRLLPKLIINLVDNAFRAVSNQPEPIVTLSWFCNLDGERLLSVTNNGPEISSWDRKTIFQGGVTTKKNSSGNHGWGLVICKDIAHELGGSLSFQSLPHQTTFTLTLPPINAKTYGQLVAT